MGDRASIELVYPRAGNRGERSVWLYTHWGATAFPNMLNSVLEKHERWYDETYLARMIASVVFQYSGIDDSTGAGLAPEYQDGVAWQVDLGSQTVTQPGSYSDMRAAGKSYTYTEFLAAFARGDSFEYED